MIEPRKKHPYVKLGERIKRVRESNEQYKNIDNFSKATDIKKGNLYNYEQGKTLPPIDKLLRICESLDKTPSYLLLPLLKLKTPDKELALTDKSPVTATARALTPEAVATVDKPVKVGSSVA